MATLQEVRSPYEEVIRELEKELEQFEELVKNDPKKAREKGYDYLVSAGFIDVNGNRCEPYV